MYWSKRKKTLLYFVIISIFFNSNLMAQSLYFSSPQESVDVVSALLLEENWEDLTSYYNLDSASSDLKDSLLIGSYFIQTKKPETVHPGSYWKYKNPFPPQFKYLSHSLISETKVKVDVIIEIDQGMGMVQNGLDSFYLIKSKKGFQLLP